MNCKLPVETILKRLVLLILIPLIGVLHPFHYIIIFLLPLLAYFGMESSGLRGAQELAVFLGVGVYAFTFWSARVRVPSLPMPVRSAKI